MDEKQKERFVALRRELIGREFDSLNEMQRQAVLTTEGPLLLLAGAGSGKTTVLIHRIANLIRFGRASDTREIPAGFGEAELEALERAAAGSGPMDPETAALCALGPVEPWRIIAITFTNKAANQLKDRLAGMLGPAAQEIWAMTFHAACCRILRREIDRLGYDKQFTIYDTADSERVMKDVMKDRNVDERELPARLILKQISRAKDVMQFPEDYARRAQRAGDERLAVIAACYAEYQRRLQEANALDFDDIILLTVKLLQDFEEVRTAWQQRFRYVLIDEYQDTNHLQYLLSALLAGGRENICVVGDDDQSIYKFRGATIENILSFEERFPGARLIRLEQNYRSTPQILDAANAVISQNKSRKGKKLWTRNRAGTGITVKETASEAEEANYVASRIFALAPPAKYKDFAILYRTNAQSNALERSFKFNGIPYRIIGGTRFFDRAEVKDMLAYLQLINNRADDLRLNRIVNNPPRGIGAKTLEGVRRLAENQGLPMYLVLADAYHYPALEKSAGKLSAFSAMIEDCAKLLDSLPLPEFYDALVEKTGYAKMLEEHADVESRTRLENVRELRSSLVGYLENHPDDASLQGFLEEIALYTDIEQYDAEADAVVMMTIHTAKGLEFPHVFLVGAEDGLFPSLRSIGEGDDLEEERRLCYVAITRAKQTLTVTHARQRMLYGRTTANRLSRFIRDIPEELVEGRIRPRERPGRTEGMYYDDLPFAESGRRNQSQLYRPDMRTGAPPPQGEGFAGWRKPAAPSPAPAPDFRVGDTVRHTAFGRGMVLSVTKMGSDALLEIAFDEKGTKKLLAKTASQHMEKVNR
ncbi:MAG: UvrD-helicase domain-containing protein [Oscillospiraceae bacterium]|nr:UvrD-helicase domain-containing protein [Oscillospiraceae bacterium]